MAEIGTATLKVDPDLTGLREKVQDAIREAVETTLQEIGLLPQEAGDPTGEVVYVTGDSGEWQHGFQAGTAVRIEDDDYALDGSYLVKPVNGGDSLYVGAEDLDVDSPRVQEIPNGTRVKALDDGRAHGLPHYAGEGTLGEVVGWTDTSAEPWAYDETYRVDFEDGMGGTLTQSVAPGSIETPALKKGTDLRLKKTADAVMAAEDGARAEVAEDYFESDRYLNVRWDESDSRRNGQMHGGYEREDFEVDHLRPYLRAMDRAAKTLAAGMPQRFVTGLDPAKTPNAGSIGVEFRDPAVRTWEGIMRDRIFEVPKPEPRFGRFCAICGGECRVFSRF